MKRKRKNSDISDSKRRNLIVDIFLVIVSIIIILWFIQNYLSPQQTIEYTLPQPTPTMEIPAAGRMGIEWAEFYDASKDFFGEQWQSFRNQLP